MSDVSPQLAASIYTKDAMRLPVVNAKAVKEAIADGRAVVIAPSPADIVAFDDLGVPACAIGQLIDIRNPDPKQLQEVAEHFIGADLIVVRSDLHQVYWRNLSHLILEATAEIAKRRRVLDIAEIWDDHPEDFNVRSWVATWQIDAESFFKIIGEAREIQKFDEADFLREETESAEPGAAKPPAKAYVSQFGALRFENLDQPGPEHTWLIDDWFTEGEKGLIAGESKSGKSFLSIEAGMCIALGVPFFDNNVKQGLVIYQAGEGARGVKKRLRAYREWHKIPADQPVPFVMLQSRIDLKTKADVDKLIREIKWIASQYPDQVLRAVFIDTLARAQGAADENSGKDIAEILDNVDRLRDACGCAVILVHHMNAAGGKIRGHSSIYGNIDQVVIVSRDKDTKIRTALLDKQKDGEDGLEFRFKLNVVELDRRADGKVITSCIVEKSVADPEKQEGVRKNRFNLHRRERLPFQALLEALEQSGEAAPAELLAPPVNLPQGTIVVRASFWKKRYSELSDIYDEDPEKFKKRIDGALRLPGESLVTYKVIGRHNQYLWWTGKLVKGFDPPKSISPQLDFGKSGPKKNPIDGEKGEDLPF